MLHAPNSSDLDASGPLPIAAANAKDLVTAKTTANSSDSKESAWLKPSNNSFEENSQPNELARHGKDSVAIKLSDSRTDGELTSTQPTPNASRGTSLNSNGAAAVPHHMSSTDNPSELSVTLAKPHESQDAPRHNFRSSPFLAASNPGNPEVLQSQLSLPTTWSTLYSTSMRKAPSYPALLHMHSGSPPPPQLSEQQRPAWRKLGGLLRSMQSEGGPLPVVSQSTLTRNASSGGSAWSRSSSGGSLVSASLTRVTSLQHLHTAAVTDTKDSKAETICRQFAEQFQKALLTGNASWGSLPEVGSVLDEMCEMVGHDGQVYVGRAAIIRRLNKGMEQFLKMLGVTGEQNDEASAIQLAAKAGKIETSLEVASLSGASIPSGRGGGPGTSQRSSLVVVTYTFKAGMRKFKLQDRFKVRRGTICRLRRLRL